MAEDRVEQMVEAAAILPLKKEAVKFVKAGVQANEQKTIQATEYKNEVAQGPLAQVRLAIKEKRREMLGDTDTQAMQKAKDMYREYNEERGGDIKNKHDHASKAECTMIGERLHEGSDYMKPRHGKQKGGGKVQDTTEEREESINGQEEIGMYEEMDMQIGMQQHSQVEEGTDWYEEIDLYEEFETKLRMQRWQQNDEEDCHSLHVRRWNEGNARNNDEDCNSLRIEKSIASGPKSMS